MNGETVVAALLDSNCAFPGNSVAGTGLRRGGHDYHEVAESGGCGEQGAQSGGINAVIITD
jgi:hypothetical protein